MGNSSNIISIPSNLAWIAWLYSSNLTGVQWEVLAVPTQTIWVSSLALSFPGFFFTFGYLWLPWILYSSSLNHNNCGFSIRILAPPRYTLEPILWLEVIKIKNSLGALPSPLHVSPSDISCFWLLSMPSGNYYFLILCPKFIIVIYESVGLRAWLACIGHRTSLRSKL